MKNKNINLLFSFFYDNRFSFLRFILYFFIAFVVLMLYDLPVEGVIYTASLCTLTALVIFAVRFYIYVKREKERVYKQSNIEFEYNNLPAPKTLAEADYQQMIKILGDINRNNITEHQAKEQENLDYYTTWVHQIKIPISVMHMLLTGEDTDENRELLAELFRIEQYSDMALSYLRLDKEVSDHVFGKVSLDSVIKQAVHKFAPQFIRKRISISYIPCNVEVISDEKWLLFIIEQLLSNALKYTDSGTIAIDVSSDKVLSIRDTGIGIADEDIPRIFEKGFTGYNGRQDKKSTGLGLYLCKKAAERISARLSVCSEVGRGSVFYVDLKTYDLVD